ncbi:MAG: phosphatidylglycerophosphatase A [Candidatus Omnitrophica bacterium]|nr:phosphatidylglycerophosphatase A [Candidatus Omnitrophota bacterium]
MHKSLLKFVLSAFGLGFIPFAPGTWGSLGGLALIWLIHRYPVVPVADLLIFFVLLLITATFASAYLKVTEGKEKDPQFIVMDEVLGIFATFISLPLSWTTAVMGFVLFRVFDTLKPFGIRRLEKIEGATGIILDDIVAGLFAHVIVFIYIKVGGPVW